MRQGAYLRGDLNREFRVIKQKHRAGQFRHHNSLRFWISGTVLQAPVVQTSDSAIHRINHYPADSVIDFRNTYPLDSDLSGG